MTETIEKIITLMQTDLSEDAPADSIQWSKNLFKTRATTQPTIKETIATFIRELSGESLATGERSSSTATASRRLYEAGDLSVDLKIEEDGEQYTISGQVLGTDEIIIVRIGDKYANSDDFGSFKIAGVKKGVHDLIIQSSGNQIVIESLELG